MLAVLLASAARRGARPRACARLTSSSPTRPPPAPTTPPTPPPPQPPPPALTIHYCAACGYAPWVAAARAAAATAGAAVTGVPVAQTGAFEVFVSTGAGGGAAAAAPALAWSKLATGQPAGVEGVGAVVEAVLAEVRRKGRAG